MENHHQQWTNVLKAMNDLGIRYIYSFIHSLQSCLDTNSSTAQFIGLPTQEERSHNSSVFIL